MGCFRIFNQNYLDEAAAISVSSEKSGFPDGNLYESTRRSKVWRSDGHWEITASNKTMVFRESTGVDLTATLTEADYSTTAAFLAHIKAQMEAVGGSTYTVEQDATTGKIKFTSDGAGGGGIFELRWPSSTGLASILGFDTAAADTGALTYTADVLKIHTSEWLLWDMGTPVNPDAVALIGNRNAPIKISPSATIKLQGNETNSWASPSYDQAFTYRDFVLVLQSNTGLHTGPLRYWRAYIEDPSNPDLYVELSIAFFGTFFEMARGAVPFPLDNTHVDRSVTVISEGGQDFTDIKSITELFGFSLFGLNIADKEFVDGIFRDFKTALPFFVSMDPNSHFGTDDYYVRYVKFNSAPRLALVSPGNFGGQVELREVL